MPDFSQIRGTIWSAIVKTILRVGLKVLLSTVEGGISLQWT